MTDFNIKYKELSELQKEATLLGSVGSLLEWDDRTYLPEEGSGYRADQSAYLSGLHHQKITNSRIGELLRDLEDEGMGGDSIDANDVNVREWRRDYDLKMKLSQSFVEELSRTSTLSQRAWREARDAKDFSLFKPWLEKLLEMKRQEADAYGYESEPYDALLDQYEPGARTSFVADVLQNLRDELVPMLQAIHNADRKPDSSILTRNFPERDQEAFVREIASQIGYNFRCGSLDKTVHPFCIGLGPKDVRITTRFMPHFLNSGLFGVIHEAGHAIYEQNLPLDQWGSPMCEAVSLGIHESQSRMWENLVARSYPFWKYWYPKAQKQFSSLSGVSLNDFYFAVNEVKPSFIRVEADELTYNLHILLRFEIERAMINNEFPAAELPEVWNSKFEEFFGIKVPDDSVGCMQDIHWSAGLFGYFPTYSLGNLNAAQLFAKAEQELGDFHEMFSEGQFSPLREWLTENVHQHGRRYPSARLIEEVTGKPLNASSLTYYLKNKFYSIYGISQ